MGTSGTIAHIEEHKVKTGESLDGLARANGLTWQQLAEFNWGTSQPKEINRCLHEFVGCLRKAKDGRNYRFDSADDPGILYIPKPWSKVGLATDKVHTIRVRRPRMFSQVEIETVDDLEHRLGNVDLVLQSLDGWPDVELTTNANGYASLKKVHAGKYKVMVKDGGPAYFLTRTYQAGGESDDAELGTYTEAVLDTRYYVSAVTRVVAVKDATGDEKDERRILKRYYARTGEKGEVEGRGKPGKVPTRNSHDSCIDNLAFASATGGAIDLRKLVSQTLRGWLQDHHPTFLARHYYAILLQSGSDAVILMNEGGGIEQRFTLSSIFQGRLVSPYGAYAVFEDVPGNMFCDAASRTNKFHVEGQTADVRIDQYVNEQEAFVEACNRHAGQVMLVYFLGTREQMEEAAFHGGTGRLEDYGRDEAVNASIHARNIAVCQYVTDIYDKRVKQYEAQLKPIKSEKELRALGPPPSPYQFPWPAGADDQRYRDILNNCGKFELGPWMRVSDQLNYIFHRKSPGSPFLRVKPTLRAEPFKKIPDLTRPGLKDPAEGSLELECEYTFDIQIDSGVHYFTKSATYMKGGGKLKTASGVPFEISAKVADNLQQWTYTARAASYKIEWKDEGAAKLSYQMAPGVWADAEMGSHMESVFAGVTLDFKDLADKLNVEEYPNLQKLADHLRTIKLQVGIGFTFSHEESILAWVSDAPGFFERRSLDDLFSPQTQWNDLNWDEQRSLTLLGWTQQSWDTKFHPFNDIPKSATKSRGALTASEKVAIVHLGFYSYEDYGKLVQELCPPRPSPKSPLLKGPGR